MIYGYIHYVLIKIWKSIIVNDMIISKILAIFGLTAGLTAAMYNVGKLFN